MVKPHGPGDGRHTGTASPEFRDEAPPAPQPGKRATHGRPVADPREPLCQAAADAVGGAVAAFCRSIVGAGDFTPYGDDRFLADWVAMGGRQQTAAFATTVCASLPPALHEEIAANRLSIVDVGCATGDALPVLQKNFPASRLAGVDASPIAINIARTLHPEFAFFDLDEFATSETRPAVVYCSNMLEHFENWSDKLAALAEVALEYVILAVPFGEYACIAGHFASFGVDTLPQRAGEAAQLAYQTVVDTGGEAGAAWAGQQLVVVYAQPNAGERLLRRGWMATRERQAAATAFALADDRRRLAEQERLAAARDAASAAALAGETEKVEAAARAAADARAALAAEHAAAADQLLQQERLAAAREAALQTALAAAAERLTAQARAAGERQAAAEAVFGDLLWQVARSGFFAAEQERDWRARAAQLATLLRPPEGPRGWRRRAALLLDPRRRRAAAAMRRGARAFARRDWERAAAQYRSATDRCPGSPSNWVGLGRSLMHQGDHPGAAAAFGHALLLGDGSADIHLQLGRALALQGRLGGALDALEAAVRLQPELAEAEQELDALYRRMVDEGDKARDALDWTTAAGRYWRALDRTPGLMPIWVQLGHVLKEQGDFGGAEAAYRRALLLDGSVADTHLQLGHLLKLQGRRSQAARAYATALRLDRDLLPAQESLHAVLGYSPSDIERFLADSAPATDRPKSAGQPEAGFLAADAQAIDPPDDDADPARFGPYFTDALCRVATQYDVIWLAVIDWNYRIQRPQHLASQLAQGGSRVFYISITFDDEADASAFRIVGAPHEGVFEVRLRVRAGPGSDIYAGLSPTTVEDLRRALDALIAELSIRTPVVVVDHPFWHPVAFAIPGASVVYDCLDLATGFANASSSLAKAEGLLIGGADLVVAASAPLARHIAATRSSVVVRNAADVDFFAGGDRADAPKERPVIGYFGAIAEWFDIAAIEHCAAARPDWEFRLIGRTDGCDIGRAAALPNVRLYGEQPYDELPDRLAAFDVALIPFRMTELIHCTNPVKLYEYMAAGKPVVSAPLPEVVEATELAYIAEDAAAFEPRIAQALAEDCDALRQRRRAWAQQHTWAARGGELAAAIDATLPLVSVIVLTYNKWPLTERCLRSVRSLSDYPRLEIIVVDNASTDATRQKLGEIADQDQRVRLSLNDRNLGFAAGNNVGLQAAGGEYVILLNNDTVVTRGWVRDLIRPLQIDPRIGMVGPLTNRIGNEQRVAVSYDDLREMASAARQLVRRSLRQTLAVRVLAFFCVALRRAMIDELGPLDEAYGVGYFEDDDYCMRAARAGWKMVVADDVFIHHHHSASFQALGNAASEQMARNRQLFESRWGPWQPHRYRDAPGFGEARGDDDD
jgi:hypothetical protein